MMLPNPKDAVHRMQLYRLLAAIIDDPFLSHNLYFKGGTCASMLGYLDRFSLDLDFDLKDKKKKGAVDKALKSIFADLDLKRIQQSKQELFYVVKYVLPKGTRNTIKISIISQIYRSNQYAQKYLSEVDRYAHCQTIETMFSHKLVSLTDRYKKYRTVAGRDLYDIHHFFLQGYRYIPAIIQERTGMRPLAYLKKLSVFIEIKINDRIISQDLSYLSPYDRFKRIRKVLKKETLLFISQEIKQLKK